MLRIANPAICPPNGWRYLHRETSYESKAIDRYNWLLDIKAHRKGNGLPPITEAEAEDQLCQTMPPGTCQYENGGAAGGWVNNRLRWSNIVEGTKAYLGLIASGFKTVEQEEANRRARICSSCYFRIEPQGCSGCTKLGQMIVGDIAHKSTPYDNHLVNRACAICSCPTQSIVHFPMPALDKADSPEKQAAFPDFCWRKQGGTNRVE